MVDLDTKCLENAVKLLKDANAYIDDAAEMLMSVTTHNNWSCKERYRINDFIIENRNNILKLQSACSSFCSTTVTVVSEFFDVENSISSMFAGVEAALANILSKSDTMEKLQYEFIHPPIFITTDPRPNLGETVSQALNSLNEALSRDRIDTSAMYRHNSTTLYNSLSMIDLKSFSLK